MSENEMAVVARNDFTPRRATLTVYFPSHEEVNEWWAVEVLSIARFETREARGWFNMIGQVNTRLKNGRRIEQWSYWERE